MTRLPYTRFRGGLEHLKKRITHTRLFEYVDPTEVGTEISLPEVEFRKPRNLFVCVSEDREDEESWELFIMNC